MPPQDTQTISTSAKVELHRIFEFRQVHPDWFAYRLTHTLQPQDCEQDLTPFSKASAGPCREGFAPMAQLEAMKGGAMPQRADPTVPQSEPVLVPARLREQLRVREYSDVVSDLVQLPGTELPLLALETGENTPEDLLLWSRYSSTFFSMKGDPLPQVLSFDYIDGNICDGAYILERALQVLKADPRVLPPDEPNAVYTERGTLRIEAVPHYNRRPGSRQTLKFLFAPTEADMKKMVDHDPKARTCDDARRKAVFELDLLGLRAAGAARCKEYYDNMADEDDEPDGSND